MFLFLSSFSFLLFCLQIQQFSFISKLRLGAIFYFCVTWSVSVKLILTIGVLLSNSCNCMTWTVFCLFFILPFYSIRRFFRIFVNLFFFILMYTKEKKENIFFRCFRFVIGSDSWTIKSFISFLFTKLFLLSIDFFAAYGARARMSIIIWFGLLY